MGKGERGAAEPPVTSVTLPASRFARKGETRADIRNATQQQQERERKRKEQQKFDGVVVADASFSSSSSRPLEGRWRTDDRDRPATQAAREGGGCGRA